MHRNGWEITCRNDETVKTPEERGVIGAWAYAARRTAEMTVEDVADLLRARGHAVHPATLRGIEGGTKKPGRALLRGLSEIYEVDPPVDQQPVESPDLVAALDRQTVVFERLAAALEQFVSQGQAPAQQPLSLEAQREVAEAERDLARRRDSERRRRPARRPDGGGGSSAFPMPHE
jgi:transcriptional regulator with XRE-family HTH domain